MKRITKKITKKISTKILFLAILVACSHLSVTGAAASGKLEEIKNISVQNSGQGTAENKGAEPKIEEKESEKRSDKTLEEELEESTEEESEEDEEEEAPKREKVSLVENYKEEYKTYEEIMGEEHFFYSSIGNGGWTDQKVHIEFPAKMKVKIKKDGAPYKYVKGKDFTKKGTYFFTLEVKGGKNKILTANFHFRIQKKPKKTAEELKAEKEASGEEDLTKLLEYEKRIQEIAKDLSGSKIAGNAIPKITEGDIPKIDDFLNIDGDKGKAEADGKENADRKEAEQNEPNLDELSGEDINKAVEEIKKDEPGNKIMNEKGEIEEERLNELIGKLDEKEKKAAEKEKVTFDGTTGLFKNALKSGDVFFTNVTNGSITNRSVMIAKSDTLSFKLFKDGKLVEDFSPGSYVEDAGSYVLYPDSEALSFKVAYKDIKPVFTFRIIGSLPVRDLGILPLSPDTELVDVQINGKNYSDAVFGKSKRMLKLLKDGSYTITTSNQAGENILNVTLDRVSPRFQVNLLENSAEIGYLSDDIARFELYKGDTLEKEGESIALIEGPGTYRLVVFDNAGNRSEATFSIKYQINQAAIIAIGIVLVLLVLGVFFFKRMNKTVKVR